MMDATGLTSNEVKERVSRGEVNSTEAAVSRTYGQIIVKNLCTALNLLLLTLGAVFVAMGEYTNALATTGIIVLNIIIATIQEMKAKRRLDKISLLLRPKVKIIRDGEEKEHDQKDIVKDDLIHLESGDQALVDGVIVEMRSMEMDESLLTGESSTVRKKIDETIYSGSFCVTGEGYYKVTAFGDESYASQMMASAKKFENKVTPLQKETVSLTKVLMAISFTYLLILMAITILDNHNGDIIDVIHSAPIYVAVILEIVPIALFLLIVIAYMVAAVRMADSGVLLQQSNAVESMSHVNTVCMDKTGTITTNKLVLEEIVPLNGTMDAEKYATMYASATGSKNRTIEAVMNVYGDSGTEAIDEILFSSERKYSGARLRTDDGEITLFLGAYPIFKDKLTFDDGISEMIQSNSEKGLRTVLLVKGENAPFFDSDDNPTLPSLDPLALLVIRDEIRPDCRETIEEFLKNDMDLKVISGDDPTTVDAIFSLAGIPGERKIISGDVFASLEGEERTKAIMETNIFGRMKPDDKEEIVTTLKENGRYVAMVGDGVNDVKALKKAHVGVALESGSGVARGVSDIVLMEDRFSALPKALNEGKRTVSGMRDILKLYLTRNFVLALIVPIVMICFQTTPLTPMTSLIYAFVAVSVAAFLMVIWAKPRENKGNILPGVFKFAIPSAIIIGFFALLVYTIFYYGSTDLLNNFIDLSFTQDELTKLGEKGLDNTLEETLARGGILLFLSVSGILQLFLITPVCKLFSVDGYVARDFKPVILSLLLLGLIVLAFNLDSIGYEELQMMLKIPALGNYQFLVYGAVAAWFITELAIMRRCKFSGIERATNKLYGRKARKAAKKAAKQGIQ